MYRIVLALLLFLLGLGLCVCVGWVYAGEDHEDETLCPCTPCPHEDVIYEVADPQGGTKLAFMWKGYFDFPQNYVTQEQAMEIQRRMLERLPPPKPEIKQKHQNHEPDFNDHKGVNAASY